MIERDIDREAAEYVLGALNAAERAAIDAERTENASLRTAIAQWEERLAPLASAVQPVEAPAGVWARIEGALAALPDPETVRVDRNEGIWVTLMPGVQTKLLRGMGPDGTMTFLLKLAPGAHVPAHHHPHTEECFVVEGVMEIGAAQFRPGDFIAYPAGIPHTQIQSATGATILIRGGGYF